MCVCVCVCACVCVCHTYISVCMYSLISISFCSACFLQMSTLAYLINSLTCKQTVHLIARRVTHKQRHFCVYAVYSVSRARACRLIDLKYHGNK